MIAITKIESDAQWHALRARNIGASEAAALLGCHPYKTAFGVWAEKAGRTGVATETPAMRRGRKLEPVAVDLIAEQFPQWTLERPGAYWCDDDIGLGATPDLFATDPQHGRGVVQIKTVEPSVFRKRWHNEDGDCVPPLYIAVQAIVEAHLTGATWAAAAALLVGFGLDIKIVHVPIHTGVIERVRAETQRMWQMVRENSPPPPDYARDGTLIARMLELDDGTEVDLTGDNELPVIVARREAARAFRSEADATVRECDAAILHRVGTATRCKFNGGSLTAKSIHRKAYSVPASVYRQVRVKSENGNEHDNRS